MSYSVFFVFTRGGGGIIASEITVHRSENRVSEDELQDAKYIKKILEKRADAGAAYKRHQTKKHDFTTKGDDVPDEQSIWQSYYLTPDIHPYPLKEEKKTEQSKLEVRKIEDDYYVLQKDQQIDLAKDDWIDTLANLHYSNVRTRHAAMNRINKDHVAEWTYKYPTHLKVEESIEAMTELIKLVRKDPGVQYSVTNASEFLGAVFFEIAKAANDKYADFLSTYSAEAFLTYDQYFVNEIFNRVVEKMTGNYNPRGEKEQLYRDLCFYINDFGMFELMDQIFMVENIRRTGTKLERWLGAEENRKESIQIRSKNEGQNKIRVTYTVSIGTESGQDKWEIWIGREAQDQLSVVFDEPSEEGATMSRFEAMPGAPCTRLPEVMTSVPVLGPFSSWILQPQEEIQALREKRDKERIEDLQKAVESYMKKQEKEGIQQVQKELIDIIIFYEYNGFHFTTIADSIVRKALEKALANQYENDQDLINAVYESLAFEPSDSIQILVKKLNRDDPDQVRAEAAYKRYKDILRATIEAQLKEVRKKR